MLYLAWKHGGENPYCLFNGLTADFRPLDDPMAEPRPPLYPSRLKLLIYGFAAFANQADSGPGSKKRQRAQELGRG